MEAQRGPGSPQQRQFEQSAGTTASAATAMTVIGGPLELPRPYVLSGWLDRRTGAGIGKRWKKRYFVVEPYALVEYRSRDGSSSKVFALTDIDEILTEDREKFTFGFRYRGNRWVTLRTASSDELDNWVSALRRAVISPPATGSSSGRNFTFNSIPKLSGIVEGDSGRAKARSESAIDLTSTSFSASNAAFPVPNSDSLDDAQSNSDGETSSDSDDDENKPQRKKWGTSLRAFFSSTQNEEGEEELSDDDDAGESPRSVLDQPVSEIAPNIEPYELRTVKVVEYDVVEIFENQRWIPLGGWGVVMLPHDRAHWTNRTGHSRMEWYRHSLDPKDSHNTANTATSGQEDRDEVPGPQIHVIKELWQWDGPWRLSPLPALNPTAHGSLQSQNGKLDSFREGLRKDLRSASLGSVGDSEDGSLLLLPPQGLAESSNSAGNSDPAQPTQTPQSPTVASKAQPPSTRASVVRSLRKRLGGASTSSVKSNDSSGNGLALAPTGGTAHSEGSVPDAASPTVSTNDGWAHGFDFPEFDHCIARGVARHHLTANNVRTRRWVRLRRRVINITGRLPPSATELSRVVPAVLSFQRQVVAEGWMGLRGRAGQWRTKYYRLIRTCEGVWDGGQGHGMISAAPSAYYLVASECRELHPIATKMYRIESTTLARANPVLIDHGGLRTNPGPSLISEPARFLVDPEAPPTMVYASVKERADDPPRSTRFELSLNKEQTFLFNADTRDDALAWVHTINSAANELLEAQRTQLLQLQQQQQQPQQQPLLSPESVGPSLSHQVTGHRLQRRGTGGRFFSILKKRPRGARGEDEDDDADKDEDGGLEVQLEDTGEEPVPAPEINGGPPPLCEADGKLREYVDITLPISLRTFFQTFIGDKARFSTADFHIEGGDDSVKASLWTETPPGGRQGRDDFDMDGYDVVPERLVSFKTPTGAPIGPSTTRVEKRQRYYYYPNARLLVLKTWAKSLDVPSGDAFLVLEKWIVTSSPENENEVRLRLIGGAHFLRNVMIKGLIIKSVESGGYKAYDLWRKKFLHYAGGKRKAEQESQEADGGTPAAQQAESTSTASAVLSRIGDAGAMVVPVIGSAVKLGALLFVVWYLMHLLWALQRIAAALERAHSLDQARH